MPNLLQKPYYPKLSDLITLDNIPSSLDFVKNISQSIFSKLYYKNYQASIGSLGESAFYSLSIVPKDQIGFDLVYGLKFVLNRDYEDSTISSFPITVQYNWPIIAYFSQFNLDSFSFSPQELYNIALVSLNLTEVTIINQAINVFTNTTQDPVNKFVDDVNVDLAGSLSTPIPYPTSDDRINELVISINNSYEEGVSLAIFTTYILDNFSISSTKNNLKKFFRAILPIDIDEYIREIITPYAAVTLETSASIEFPRNILKPWIQNASGELSPDLDETHKTYFDFAKAVFYADTAAGIGYSVDIAGTLSPTYSEIGNTGLLIQVDRLKLDLSRTKNIPEADFYGYSPDFMGVYARAISVTFPPKWFYDDNTSSGNSTTTLRLGAYDLLVGNGGVSGTIMLESVPIINPGGSFEYYNNDFSFDYPVTLYDLDPLTEEVMEITVDNYSELKNILATLSSASEAPYPFKFPLSLTPIGQSDSLVFDTAPAYQIYLAGLSNNVLWKRIGKEDGFAVGFRSFDITLLKNSVTASNIAGSLKIPKFKYPDDTPVVGGQPVQIDVAGHLEGNGDFLLTASTNPPFPIQFGNVFKLHLRSVELGKEGDDFFIGASADVEFLDFLGDLLEGQTISISALRIYSDGRIDFRVNGGNLTLPKPVKLKIGPTELSVTAIHFGSHEREYKGKIRKYNYFGFDGGVSIGVAGIDARGDGIKYYYTIDDEPDKPHDSYLHIQTIHIDMVIPANTDLGSGTLPLVNNNGDPIYHHFKILTENTAGLISTEDKILTIGNEWAFNIQTNPFLTRYAPYFSTNQLVKKDNIYLPPYNIYGTLYNSPLDFDFPFEQYEIWKLMKSKYIILPEILQDKKKNPLVYNIKTRKFGCYYTVNRIWNGSLQGSMGNFLRNSVKKTRTAGARECIVNLGSDSVFIEKNIKNLQHAVASENDRGMDIITLIRNGVISHYTPKQILYL